MSIRLDTVPSLDRQTDRQTDGHAITISRSACIACWCMITKPRCTQEIQAFWLCCLCC